VEERGFMATTVKNESYMTPCVKIFAAGAGIRTILTF
jgi:hypothetical protein